MKQSRTRSEAFTLIELLAVVAIISVLAALAFTGVRAAMDRSHQATCLSNQRQIFSAILLYAADNQNHLPWAVSQDADKVYLWKEPKPWLQDVLVPYAGGAVGNLSRAFRCPGVKQAWLRSDPNANHYRYNARQAAGANLASVGHTAIAVVTFDTAWPDWKRGELPHDGVIIQYADGHAARMEAEKFLDPAVFGADLESPLMTNGWR